MVKYLINSWTISIFFSIFLNVSSVLANSPSPSSSPLASPSPISYQLDPDCQLTGKFLPKAGQLESPEYSSTPGTNIDPTITNVPNIWRTKFPFDLVYPLPPKEPIVQGETCPTINFFGKNREVCSIPTLTATIKNVFLLKVVITSIFHL